MKLFEMKDFSLQVQDEVWGVSCFKAILKRDKSRQKETAFKEVLFIYFYLDLRSDYVYIADDKIREREIKKDIGLPDEWKIDDTIKAALVYYDQMSVSPIARLYKSSLKSADEAAKYLENTGDLLKERTQNGSTVTTLPMIMTSLKSVPIIMRELKAAYKEVLSEVKDNEGKAKGSRSFGLFEDGLTYE